MTKHRRTNYLIKTGLQLRYMGIIVISMLMIAFFVGWVTYYTTWSAIANASNFTLYSLPAIFETVNNELIKWIFVFIGIIAVLSIFISHRIAGPVYRLEQTTKLIASGDLTHRIHLRSGDELTDLQDAFNKMSDSLVEMINKDREVVARLIAASGNLKQKITEGDLKSEDLEKIKNELDSITSELQTLSSTFKLQEQEAENGDAKAENQLQEQTQVELQEQSQAESQEQSQQSTEEK